MLQGRDRLADRHAGRAAKHCRLLKDEHERFPRSMSGYDFGLETWLSGRAARRARRPGRLLPVWHRGRRR